MVFRRKRSFSISAAESVLQGEKLDADASILSCHNVSSGNLRKVNYFTIHSRSVNGHPRHRDRQPKPARTCAAWVEKQHSTPRLHRRPMRETSNHNLTPSAVWITPELFQTTQNVAIHATYSHYFG